LGATTAAFVDWPKRRLWLLFGGIVIIATVILDIYLPVQAVNIPYTRYSISYSDLVTTITWLILSGTIVTRTWRDFRRTTFPWHANRLLFWLILLSFTFTGEALLFFNYTGLTLTGQIIRFLGVFGLTYAVSSHRIIDVRTKSQSALAFILITIISALPLAGTIIFVQNVTQNQPFAFVYMLIAVVVGFIFYAPFRRIIEKLFQRLLVGEGVDTSQVLRHYSQDIYQILDVQQLSQVVIGTLSDLLDVQRGALMLINNNQNGYTIAPIPALGAINRQKTQLPPKSLFIKTLSQMHQPLLQYELDFNRDYASLDPAIRSWLQEMAMDVYVPVIATNNLEGVIAVGPKKSGVPYQPGELELMQILADQTVVALQNARLYSELGQQNEKIRRLNLDLTGQNERLEIMDRVKSDFITIASHELRTPLTQVKGYTDILNSMNEESDLSREQTREIINHIIRAGDRLDVLI
ncbi:MAG: GAF domain-containing protein, partial [Anaerolineales bacterium]|nr:GAF domain-containing protein [Anaerolineales bacterium]